MTFNNEYRGTTDEAEAFLRFLIKNKTAEAEDIRQELVYLNHALQALEKCSAAFSVTEDDWTIPSDTLDEDGLFDTGKETPSSLPAFKE